MPRLRLGVALLVPEPVAAEVDGLRRACGDGALGRVPPHLTLVPPVNVAADRVVEALAVLRRAASAVAPFTLRLGPPATFLPTTPTLHLAVGGSGDATAVLRRLRDEVFRPPLERPLTHPFVPHVTLADEMAPERIAAALPTLRNYVVDATFDRVHLLEEQRPGDGPRRWVPVADAPFTPPVVVGRGGVELDLAVSRLLDPEALAFEVGRLARGRGADPVRRRARRCGVGRGRRPATRRGGRGGAGLGRSRGSPTSVRCWWPRTSGARGSPATSSPPSATPPPSPLPAESARVGSSWRRFDHSRTPRRSYTRRRRRD